MRKSDSSVKNALLVLFSALLLLVLAFAIYFLLFLLLERGNQGDYGYVSDLRAGYGVVWLLLAFFFDRTKIRDWLKAGVFSAGLAIFVITMGVRFYENPTLIYVIAGLTTVLGILYLVYRKKEWFYYFGVILALSAALYYVW